MHKMLSVKGSRNLQLHLHQKAAGLVKSTEQLISPEFQVLGEGKKKKKSFKSSTAVIFVVVVPPLQH